MWITFSNYLQMVQTRNGGTNNKLNIEFECERIQGNEQRRKIQEKHEHI